jgi:hypothetical protein
MNRRVALVCLALAGLCGCSLLFSLDALDPGERASADSGGAQGVSASDAGDTDDASGTDDATNPNNPTDATGVSPTPPSGDAADSTSGSTVADSTAEPEATTPPVDGGHREASMEGGAPVDSPAVVDAPPFLNMVPAGYAGTAFKTLTIPGTIYLADYDKGGAGVAYCVNGTATGAACQNATISDWCCATMNACDERAEPTVCPTYRADNDNAGLSHMNMGAPDDYAATGPSWAASAAGPMLTGPMVTAGTPVPQDAHTTTEQDVYLSHTNAGEWAKYTVQVLEAGKYSVGGFMAVPPTTTLSLTFGSGVTTGTFPVPASPCTWTGCPSTFHSWSSPSNLATVTFPVAGTYLMIFTIVNNALNPNYLTFTKM